MGRSSEELLAGVFVIVTRQSDQQTKGSTSRVASSSGLWDGHLVWGHAALHFNIFTLFLLHRLVVVFAITSFIVLFLEALDDVGEDGRAFQPKLNILQVYLRRQYVSFARDGLLFQLEGVDLSAPVFQVRQNVARCQLVRLGQPRASVRESGLNIDILVVLNGHEFGLPFGEVCDFCLDSAYVGA